MRSVYWREAQGLKEGKCMSEKVKRGKKRNEKDEGRGMEKWRVHECKMAQEGDAGIETRERDIATCFSLWERRHDISGLKK